jgi:hypothetical protein
MAVEQAELKKRMNKTKSYLPYNRIQCLHAGRSKKKLMDRALIDTQYTLYLQYNSGILG